ncbi:MAG: orotidine-5'-phosphate decarboxylase [Armatimonadota bacterium]
MSHAESQLIVALDYPDATSALGMAEQLAGLRPWMKVGLELLMSAGPKIVAEIRHLGVRVFLDGKFHDIPNTVAGAVRAATYTGANMLNVHACGGLRMMQAAHDAADEVASATGTPHPLLIAVTVLTSLSPHELQDEIGCTRPPLDQAVAMAKLAKEAGLDGVVASAHEVEAIKEACGHGFLVVTPGIRPASGAADDQRRVTTPREAIEVGADFLVVGRPITQAPDPVAACKAVLEEIEAAKG